MVCGKTAAVNSLTAADFSPSFPPPPTRGQATAGINCRRAANTDGAKHHLTTGGKAAAVFATMSQVDSRLRGNDKKGRE